MFLYYLFTLLLTLIYLITNILILKYWRNDDFPVSDKHNSFSIVIAARNESKNIKKCIDFILKNEYSFAFYEIIVVNDHSTDGTVEILKSIKHKNLRILENPKNIFGKKAAINLAIAQSNHNWILQTDADTMVPKNWISTFNNFISHRPNLQAIAAPVIVSECHSYLHNFQRLDFIGLMGFTNLGITSHFFSMANGANFCFTKAAYNNFSQNRKDMNHASGDDMFFMHYVHKNYKNANAFLINTNSVVYTKPISSLTKLLKQRKRWATKSNSYVDYGLLIILAMLSIFYITLITSIVLGSFLSFRVLITGIGMLFIKLIVDNYTLNRLGQFYKHNRKLFFLPVIINIGITILSVIWAIFPTLYVWKERRTK